MGGVKRQVDADVLRSGGLQLASRLPAGHSTRGFHSHMHDVREASWLAICCFEERTLPIHRSKITSSAPVMALKKEERIEHHDPIYGASYETLPLETQLDICIEIMTIIPE
jgi:hypothetical protein